MATVKSVKETQTYIDEDGNKSTSVVERTIKVERTNEPDFIKLYTNMWCEFNQIPNQWRPLFLELVARMTYADASDIEHSQIVATGGMTKEAICRVLGWKSNMYQKGLKALKEAGAIKQKMKGFYQINPNYAGRGEWKYNPKLARGGVEDLKAKFDFKEGTVNVKIVWADDGENNSHNEEYRKGLGVKAKDNTVMKSYTYDDNEQIPGQMDFCDIDGVVPQQTELLKGLV